MIASKIQENVRDKTNSSLLNTYLKHAKLQYVYKNTLL